MSQFAAALDYIREFDPLFEPVGARLARIEELEDAAERPLPPIYVDFLRVMGENMDWLAIENFDLSIGSALEFYREGEWLSNSPYVRIGAASTLPLMHPHLENLGGDEPEVIAIPDYGPATFQQSLRGRMPCAGSLTELICMPVFEQFELEAPDRHTIALSAPAQLENGPSRVVDLLVAEGFTRRSFSSRTGQALSRQDAAVKAVQSYLAPLRVTISADSELVAKAVGLKVQAALGL